MKLRAGDFAQSTMDTDILQHAAAARQIPGRFRKLTREYFLVFVVLLGGGLIISGALEIYFRYIESREQVAIMQGELAQSAAQRIAQFILTIEDRMKSATISRQVARDEIALDYQFELAKLLATTPAITEVTATDAAGQVVSFASRFRVKPRDSERDLSQAASFHRVKQGISYFGPVLFIDDAIPSINLAVPIERFPGEVIGALQARIDLRQIWEVLRDLQFSAAGYAYVVTRSGELIAHSDPGLTLQRVRAKHIEHVQAAFEPNPLTTKPQTTTLRNFDDQNVLSSFVYLPNLEWAVFAEQPVNEAYGNLYRSILRTSVLLFCGLGVALIASVFVGRRVVRPLAVLQTGVERIRGGDLDHSIEIKTGNEIESLADDFNKMVEEIKSAQQNLENKVQQRTKELSALVELSSLTTSSLDIGKVLDKVVSKISEVFKLDNVRIYLFGENSTTVRPSAMIGRFDQRIESVSISQGKGLVAQVAETGQTFFFDDIENDPVYARFSQNSLSKQYGFHFLALVPIKFGSRPLGVVVCNSLAPRALSGDERRLLLSLVDQIGPALDNLNLVEALRNQGNQLDHANRQLQELDRLKSHFLSNVSHELRTPLTAISSLVDNMLDGVTGAMSQKQTQYLNGVKDSSERLTRLINDLLDLSIIQSGKVRLEPSRFSLSDLVNRTTATMAAIAQAKGVTFEVSDSNGNQLAWADRDKIAQVLTNLISNAVKFTPSGGKVVVGIGTAENDGSLAVSVSDTGPGIPPEECEQIFDEFYQISRPGEEKAKGVGLGLAISKKLVEMNNGKISVESKLGSGTTFKFTVPAFREDSTIAEQNRGARK